MIAEQKTLQMQQPVDLPKVLTTVILRAQEKISGKALQRLLLTKQGKCTAQVENTSCSGNVMCFQFINFLPCFDWPGETCRVCCPEVTCSGSFGPLCSWWLYLKAVGVITYNLLDYRFTPCTMLVPLFP